MENEQDIFYNLVEKAKKVTLSERERSSLFLTVDKFVEKNPLQATQTGFADSAGVPGEAHKGPLNPGFISTDAIRSFISYWEMYGLRTGVALLVLIFLGGGASFAAQNSLPGDILYPMRVNVNEEVKAAFLSGTKRSAYEIQRVQNRVNEMQTLANEGKLDDKIQQKVVAGLNTSVSTAQENLTTLSKRGDLKNTFELSQALENVLAQSQNTVAKLALNSTNGSDKKFISIAEALNDSREASAVVRQLAEDQIFARNTNDDETQAIAIAKSNSVKQAIESIQEEMVSSNQNGQNGPAVAAVPVESVPLTSPAASPVDQKPILNEKMIASLKVTATSTISEVDNDNNNVVQAQKLFDLGQQKLTEKNYSVAYSLFKQSYDLTQKVKGQMNNLPTPYSEINLNDTVNGNGSIKSSANTANVSSAVSGISGNSTGAENGSAIKKEKVSN